MHLHRAKYQRFITFPVTYEHIRKDLETRLGFFKEIWTCIDCLNNTREFVCQSRNVYTYRGSQRMIGTNIWRESSRRPLFSRAPRNMAARASGRDDVRLWRFRTSPPVRARKLVICLSIRARAWKKESVYGVFNGSEREEIWPPVGRRENFGFQRVFAEMCIGSQSARGTAMFAAPLPRIISGSRGLVFPRAGGLREGSPLFVV